MRVLAVAAALGCGGAWAQEYVWRGGDATNPTLASVAANWSPEGVPGVNDDVVLNVDSGSRPLTWDLDNGVDSWMQTADYTGTVTFMTGPLHEGERDGLGTRHGVLSSDGKRRELVVKGDITLNGGTWTHQAAPSLKDTDAAWTSGEGVYRLIARAGGTFTIGANAHISADNAGFRKTQGLGYIKDRGASHGGTAFGYGKGDSSFTANVYGRVRTPVTHGSGGEGTNGYGSGPIGAGGGAVELSADGAMILDGQVSASANTGVSYNSGAGGSVYLKAAQLTGSGSVSASSFARDTGAGAGGRIAFILTGAGATLDGFTGSVLCDGNSAGCHAGTIYKETPADRDEGGVLEIVGTGKLATGYRGNYTLMLPNGEDLTFKRIVLTNKVMFAVGPGATVKTDELKTYSKDDYLIFAGGRLVVPNGEAFADVSLRNDFYASQIGTPEGAAGTNVLASGMTFIIDRGIAFDGTFHMLSGSKVTHTGADSADSAHYRADFSAGGFVLENGASVDVTSLGYPATQGPGRPVDDGKTDRSGSHGGLAHDVGSVRAYGSITRPTTLGSGGKNGKGGGATHITVSGHSVINGKILSGGQSSCRLAGAGGSVWLETGTLEGASTAEISANGGTDSASHEFYSGAGGRIAVTLTDAGADFSQYKGKICAKGGVGFLTAGNVRTCYGAGDGTVYLRKGGEQENAGTLLVDGDVRCANADNYTDISAVMTECTVGHLVITNGGNPYVRRGATLGVRESFVNASRHQGDRVNGEPSDGVLAAGTVAFVDKTVEASVTGTNTFMCLKCAEPGKTVRFGAAGDTYTKIDALGSFDVAGEDGSPVFLRGLMDATPWLFELRGKANVAYADVKDSNANPGDKVSVDDTNVDSGNNFNWGFITITPGETITWNGSKGTAWGTADNWDRGRAPVDTDVIVIPADCDNMPELMEPLAANKITIAVGATLKLNTFSLTVTNGLDCAGEIVCSATETLTLAGDVTIKGFTAADSTVVLAGGANRTIDFADQTFRNLEIAGTAGQTTFTDGFSADFITCLRTDAASTLVFAAGKTVTVGQLKLNGAQPNALPGLTLASSEPGTRWKLNVTGKADVTGVIVTDSDASAGKRVAAFNPSEDGHNNVNWLFGVTQSTWIGPAAGGNWSDAANWADGKVPDADTRVLFDQDATVTIDSPDAVVMQLEVEGATLTVKGAETLRVTTLLEILAGGTLTQNAAGNSIHVEGSAYVRAGGVWTHALNGTTDQDFGVKATVDGNFTVDAGGKVEGNMKGFNDSKGPGGQQYASHGARYKAESKPSYGSMFRSTDIGSGGGYNPPGATGGGRISLTVGGTLEVNGSVEVGAKVVAYYPGSAGSILLTCGRLAGAGTICAQGGNRTSGGDAGCGGRVAVYLTEATDFADFLGSGGKIQAYGGVNNNVAGANPLSPCGTVYLQPNGVENGGGTVYIYNNGGAMTTGGVDLPVLNSCDDDVKSYKTVTFDVAEGGTLFLTGDVTVKELELGAKSRLNLNGHTLTIKSHAHKNGKGWPADWQAKIVYPGTDAKGNPGKIVWEPWGMMLMIR